MRVRSCIFLALGGMRLRPCVVLIEVLEMDLRLRGEAGDGGFP